MAHRTWVVLPGGRIKRWKAYRPERLRLPKHGPLYYRKLLRRRRRRRVKHWLQDPRNWQMIGSEEVRDASWFW